MIDQNDLLLLSLAKIRPALEELIGSGWPEFLHALSGLTHDLERGDQSARRRILDLFDTYAEAYRRLVTTLDQIGLQLTRFHKATSVPIVAPTRSFATVAVYFATNRSHLSTLTPPLYGTDRGKMRFGRNNVSVQRG
jgi:hypothetical protein